MTNKENRLKVMSCLFLSLAPAVGKQPQTIRAEIVNYLKSDPPIFDTLKASDVTQLGSNLSLERYTDAMARQFTWGGALEIKAFVELYGISVTVHVLYTGKKFTVEREAGPCTRAMHISYNGSHFEPLIFVAVDEKRVIWQK